MNSRMGSSVSRKAQASLRHHEELKFFGGEQMRKNLRDMNPSFIVEGKGTFTTENLVEQHILSRQEVARKYLVIK